MNIYTFCNMYGNIDNLNDNNLTNLNDTYLIKINDDYKVITNNILYENDLIRIMNLYYNTANINLYPLEKNDLISKFIQINSFLENNNIDPEEFQNKIKQYNDIMKYFIFLNKTDILKNNFYSLDSQYGERMLELFNSKKSDQKGFTSDNKISDSKFYHYGNIMGSFNNENMILHP